MSGLQNLEDYQLVVNEDGSVFIQNPLEDPMFLWLRHKCTQETVKVEYSSVAEHYGCSVVSSSIAGQGDVNMVPPPSNSGQDGENAKVPPFSYDRPSEDENLLLPQSPSDIISADEKPKDTASTRYTGACWSDGETKLMLSLYREYFEKIGPLKQLKNKKALWQLISKSMKSQLGSDFSEVQIQNRFKTVSRRHKCTLDNNRTSGASRAIPAFADEFAEITSMDDSLEPEVRMETTSVHTKSVAHASEHPSQQEPKAGTSAGKARLYDVQHQMLDAFRNSQQDKNRRHLERMEKLDTITALLKTIAEKP